MGEVESIDRQIEGFRRAEGADSHEIAPRQTATQTIDNRGVVSSGVMLSFAVVGLTLGALGFLMGGISLMNSSKVADFAFIAGEAKSKAETATARANVSELYAKQVFTELNRLGYPVKTPAEQHAPQPSDNVSEVPGK